MSVNPKLYEVGDGDSFAVWGEAELLDYQVLDNLCACVMRVTRHESKRLVGAYLCGIFTEHPIYDGAASSETEALVVSHVKPCDLVVMMFAGDSADAKNIYQFADRAGCDAFFTKWRAHPQIAHLEMDAPNRPIGELPIWCSFKRLP